MIPMWYIKAALAPFNLIHAENSAGISSPTQHILNVKFRTYESYLGAISIGTAIMPLLMPSQRRQIGTFLLWWPVQKRLFQVNFFLKSWSEAAKLIQFLFRFQIFFQV